MREKVYIKTIFFTIGLMICALITTLAYIAADKYNQERCYNLPLNEFYADNSCLKYKEVLR